MFILSCAFQKANFLDIFFWTSEIWNLPRYCILKARQVIWLHGNFLLLFKAEFFKCVYLEISSIVISRFWMETDQDFEKCLCKILLYIVKVNFCSRPPVSLFHISLWGGGIEMELITVLWLLFINWITFDNNSFSK